ncbi:hypothetical protein KUTeg_018005 [Tegillarca granosa]|uniref:Ig-like domain-containing protein n=1 Tax=Tegillarca granosa TaxID=220873 RepID=A0ABQ9ELF2_TEGGR|nr:hypothetical protein KUTeg_018005 [Tegillarca granosa]
MGGTYECVAYNNVPPAVKRQIPVKVLYRPEIKLNNRRLGQYRGKETILECRITASPLDTYNWKRYSYGHLDDTWKYRKETFQEDKNTITYTLRIRSVEAHDFGMYTCEASNSVGRSQANMELYGNEI